MDKKQFLVVLLPLVTIASLTLISYFEQPYLNLSVPVQYFTNLSDQYQRKEQTTNQVIQEQYLSLNNYSDEKRLKRIILFKPRPVMKRIFYKHGFTKKLYETKYGACEFQFGNPGQNRNNPYNPQELWDAVMFVGRHLPRIAPPPKNDDQVFIFFEREPPTNLHSNAYRQQKWTGVFNWTLTYRQDSDIVYPYGQVFKNPLTAETKKNYSEIFRQKSKNVLWFVSHCKTQSKRAKYVSLLKDMVETDIYGKCGRSSKAICNTTKTRAGCSGVSASTYKFYLSFENSLCEDYVTEKTYLWLGKNIIPVVRGGAAYSELLPEGTYIDTSKFKSVKELANFLKKVGSSEELYTNYLKEQDKYVSVSYIIGNYFKTVMKNVCERLYNIDQNRKWYESISDWWFKCHPPGDLVRDSTFS